MKISPAAIPDILIIEPDVFADDRGFFLESYNQAKFRQSTGIDVSFVQDNHSQSVKNVLRGLHYQVRQSQGKLVRVISGEVFDVVVDIRKSSPTFGKWVAERLTAENRKQLWIPIGFAHGFLVMSDRAEFLYKTTDYYAPEQERCIRWDDHDLGIAWPIAGLPIVSEKDARGAWLKEAEVFA